MRNEPAWLPIARAEEGVRETPGGGNTPRVLEYHRATSLKATADSVPWCSAFACWAMERAGIRSTRSAAARSWLDWGVGCAPQLGCIVVLWRGRRDGAQGHVGFLLGSTASTVTLLGGNQGDAVSVATFPASRVLGYRWPAVVTTTVQAPLPERKPQA